MIKTVVLILIITLAVSIVGMTAAMIFLIKKRNEISQNADKAGQDESEKGEGTEGSAKSEVIE